MQSVPCRQNAGFDAKLRQRIGKEERHIHVGKAVVVVAAIQQIVGGVARTAGNGDGLRGVKAFIPVLVASE
jgi:hypothetical protein